MNGAFTFCESPPRVIAAILEMNRVERQGQEGQEGQQGQDVNILCSISLFFMTPLRRPRWKCKHTLSRDVQLGLK